MPRFRVLFITPGPLLGGGATVSLYRLIKYLDRQRYEPIVLCHECGPTNPYVTKLQELGVEVLCLRNSDGVSNTTSRQKRALNRRARSPWVERLAAWKRRHRPVEAAYSVWRTGRRFLAVDLPRCLAVARIIKERQINLVHLNNAVRSHRGDIMAARLVGVPCVCHVRVFDRFEVGDGPLLRSVDYFVYVSRALKAHVQARWPAAVGSRVYDGLELADTSRVRGKRRAQLASADRTTRRVK
jgi:hypothetical protein